PLLSYRVAISQRAGNLEISCIYAATISSLRHENAGPSCPYNALPGMSRSTQTGGRRMVEKHLRVPVLLSIAAALVTLGLKTSSYLVTGSVGLLSDAAESLVNLLAALTAYFS